MSCQSSKRRIDSISGFMESYTMRRGHATIEYLDRSTINALDWVLLDRVIAVVLASSRCKPHTRCNKIEWDLLNFRESGFSSRNNRSIHTHISIL